MANKCIHNYASEAAFFDAVVDNIHDHDWRLRNLYNIVNKSKKQIVFNPNYVQDLYLKNSTRHDAILKSRQLGFSTLLLLKKLDKVLWSENRTACIIAHEQDAIKKLFRIVRNAYEFLHPALRPKLARGGGSLYEMYFPETNSRIYCDLEVRGDTISDLHLSEYAFVKDVDKILATMDAVPIDTGEITIESTPNGLNHFYDNWNSLTWNFKRHFFPWYLHYEYAIDDGYPIARSEEERALVNKSDKLFEHKLTDSQIRFRRFKIAQRPGEHGKKHFLQEYPEDDVTCFLTSGGAVFDLMLISELLKNAPEPVSEAGVLKTWAPVEPRTAYACGVDTAEGVGGDYSVATLYKVSTMEEVAELRTNTLKPAEFGQAVFDLCKSYVGYKSGWPLLAVERNNHGHTVIQKLNDLNYPNLFRGHDKRDGWLTNRATRPIMVDEFIECVSDGSLKIRSKTTLDECRTLVNNKGKIEAAEGKHDDGIMSAALVVQLIKRSGLTFSTDIIKL